MQLKLKNTSHHPLPRYETALSAGMDLRAYLPDGPVTLRPMERGLIKTGLFMELPAGYEAQAYYIELEVQPTRLMYKLAVAQEIYETLMDLLEG